MFIVGGFIISTLPLILFLALQHAIVGLADTAASRTTRNIEGGK